MDRNNQHRDDELIDLGSVAEDTKGGGKANADFIGLPQPQVGLSDD